MKVLLTLFEFLTRNSDLVSFMSSGKVIAMELVGIDAVAKWRKMIGPTNTSTAKQESPGSIRARFGHDQTRNAVHGSDSTQSAKRESDFFFGKTSDDLENGASFSECALCIVKSHAVAEGISGVIVQHILDEGFEVSAMEMFNLDQQDAADFFEIYKGVVPEYQKMVEEISNGPCIALEIIGGGKDTVEQFRHIVGPADPELAKLIRPKTIRAKYGVDKVHNAVHCTDLEEDGILEVEFFFGLLQQRK